MNFFKTKIFNGTKILTDFDRKIVDAINSKNFIVLKILKDNYRSSVYLIELFDKKYIYKIPKEKNTKIWQRFLSFFRGSESYRNFVSCQNILENGFFSPRPILSFTKTFLGFTVYSYFIMEYIDGDIPRKEDIKIVVDLLNEIHKKGFIHGDSQTTNFIIKDEKLYILDSKFNKNFFSKLKKIKIFEMFWNFWETYEFVYLEKNYIDFYNEELNLYDKDNFYYKFCKFFDYSFVFLSKLRKKIKNIFNFLKFKEIL